MPLEITNGTNNQAKNYSKIITKLTEYQQKAKTQQFVVSTDTNRAIDQLFEDYDLLNILDLSRLTRVTSSTQNNAAGTASLQQMILFEIIEFDQIHEDTDMDYTSLTFIVQKADANYIASHLAKLLHNQPVMILKRELPSINYDIHESRTFFSFELFAKLVSRHREYLYLDSMSKLLAIMSNKNVLNELKATNINTLTADMLPLFYQKLRRDNNKVTIDKIDSVLPFIQKLSLAELL